MNCPTWQEVRWIVRQAGLSDIGRYIEKPDEIYFGGGALPAHAAERNGDSFTYLMDGVWYRWRLRR